MTATLLIDRDSAKGRLAPGRTVLARPWVAMLLLVVGLVGASVLVWFRLTPIARDTLWAEDGKVFLFDAQRGGLATTFVPYAGYLQFVPRLIAGAVVWFVPVSGWADAMTAAACAVAGGAAVVVFVASRSVVPAPGLRAVLAAVTVLLPLGPRDVLGNTANLHSVLLWALFWVVLARPATRRGAVALGLIGTAAALSEIQAAFLLPVMAVIVWRHRSSLLLLTGPLLGVAAQLVATVAAPRASGQHIALSGLSVAEGYVINAIMPDLASYRGIGPLLAAGGLLIGALVLAGILALAVVAFRYATWRQRVALIGALGLSIVVYAVSVVVNPGTYYQYAALSRQQLLSVWLTRYGVVPGMLLLGMVIVSAAVLGVGDRGARTVSRTQAVSAAPVAPRVLRTVAMVAVFAVVGCLVAGYIPSSTRRSGGPAWSPQIAAATDLCTDSPSVQWVSLNETLRWKVPVECALLIADSEG